MNPFTMILTFCLGTQLDSKRFLLTLLDKNVFRLDLLLYERELTTFSSSLMYIAENELVQC